MYKQKLCLAMNGQFGISPEEQLKLFKQTGFEGFAIDMSGRNVDPAPLAKLAKEENIFIEYIHAPFNKSDDMWMNSEIGEIAVNELLEYLEICSEHEIPILVAHTFIGFDSDNIPTEIGIERYGRLAKRSDELGVKLALENTEGEEYLFALMEAFKGEKSVGFCWDTGHELCYNRGKDLMAMFGDRLFVTHLNDNLGVKDYEGKITFIDDLHLLPFDGISDWTLIAEKLAKCGFDGPLTFELNTKSKPGRHENDKYSDMPIERYIAEAYNRACRVANLFIKAKENRK
ncbi:MAG: sugar phosphate isomerase/epimerase [Clostridia bacterium]|nr:sugar phosphate isomerase/epimerase [Clostridia bacterium]MBQ7122918.1 sugar phosphate isomerase/epimerase [Clostridia bacterium]